HAATIQSHLEAVMLDPFTFHALADTGFAQQINHTLLQNAGAATALHVVSGLSFDDDVIDPCLVQQYITPRLYANYSLTPEWTLRAGVARGFKAPTLRQVTAEYCMTTGGSSLPRGPLCGNPDLEPEESTTQELGIRYDGSDGRSFGLTLFNNDFETKVVSYDSGQADPVNPARPLYVYDNIDEVRIRGVELSAALPLHADWLLSGNYTYTDSERRGGGEPAFDGSSLDGQPLDKTPEHMAHLRLEWNPLAQLSTYIRANYVGRQYYTGFRNGAVSSRERSASTTVDLGATYRVTEDVSLSAAVLN